MQRPSIAAVVEICLVLFFTHPATAKNARSLDIGSISQSFPPLVRGNFPQRALKAISNLY